MRQHTRYGQRVDLPYFAPNTMKNQALVAIMLISCILAGCTEADVESTEQALGCTYSDASNYNATAVIDDGSCAYPEPPLPVPGCMYQDALNHNPSATEDDGSCRYPIVPDSVRGCTYSDAYNYEMNATEDDGSCIYDSDGDGIIDAFEEAGCTDVNANNHNSSSTDDDGSCDYDEDDDGVYDWAESEGCIDANATNYDSSATESNQTMCEYPYVMTLEDFGSFLADTNDDGEADGLVMTIDALGNVPAFIRVIDVTESTEEEEGDTNANTTSVEIIFGHDPNSEIMYNSMVLRFLGDISMEQTTVQGHDGINYRIGSTASGSWYYARDEVYQYENPFSEDDGEEGGGTSDDDAEEDESICDEFINNDPFNWTDNWTLSFVDGVNTAEGSNGAKGLDARLEFVGSPPHLKIVEIISHEGMERCSIEILDASLFELEIDATLPRTSMTMKIENEADEESGGTKTWSGDLGEDHFEEVNLTEIALHVYAADGDSEGDGGSLVTSMVLSEQSSTYTDQCYQWTLSWADNDNDGYTSAGDTYTITRNERLIDPCSDDDEYRNKDFQIVFYDLWADMPTGGVFTPGFGLIAAITALLASSMFVGRRGL